MMASIAFLKDPFQCATISITMVTVKIGGGLGNQMFQYAFGRALALRNKDELRIDPSTLYDVTPWKNFTYRNYALSTVFKIDPPFNFAAKLQSRVRIPYLAKAVNKYYPRLLGKIGYWQYVQQQDGYVFDPKYFELRGNVYLNGYWQSERYFKEYESVIRSDFSFRPPLRGSTAALAEKISTSNAVAVFIRRKELLSVPIFKERYYVATPEFFGKAVAMMKERLGTTAVFYIFSDEIDWCRENFKMDGEHVFVGDEHNGPEFAHNLHLIALCKHFVIANSSFPWWGAWLSTNKDKIVIAPSVWDKQAPGPKNPLLESWIGI